MCLRFFLAMIKTLYPSFLRISLSSFRQSVQFRIFSASPLKNPVIICPEKPQMNTNPASPTKRRPIPDSLTTTKPKIARKSNKTSIHKPPEESISQGVQMGNREERHIKNLCSSCLLYAGVMRKYTSKQVFRCKNAIK